MLAKLKLSIIVSFITTATVFLASSNIQAQTLVWDPSSGTVEGYKVHYGTNPNALSNFQDAGNTTQYNLDSLPLSEGVTYYISVSAYNSAGESEPCAPVVYTPGDNTPPTPPIGLTAQ